MITDSFDEFWPFMLNSSAMYGWRFNHLSSKNVAFRLESRLHGSLFAMFVIFVKNIVRCEHVSVDPGWGQWRINCSQCWKKTISQRLCWKGPASSTKNRWWWKCRPRGNLIHSIFGINSIMISDNYTSSLNQILCLGSRYSQEIQILLWWHNYKWTMDRLSSSLYWWNEF